MSHAGVLAVADVADIYSLTFKPPTPIFSGSSLVSQHFSPDETLTETFQI